MDARNLYDRAVFDRWYDGMAARQNVDPKVVAWLAYCRGARIASNTQNCDPVNRDVRVDVYLLGDPRDVLIQSTESTWRTMVDGDEVVDSYVLVDGQRLIVPQSDADLAAYFAAQRAEV